MIFYADRKKRVGLGMNSIDVKHDRLGKFRRLTGYGAVEHKAGAQQVLWDKQWQRRQALERKYFDATNSAVLQALKKIQADEQSEEAGHQILSHTSILLDALRSQPLADWTVLYDRAEFAEPPPAEPIALQLVPEPRTVDYLPARSGNLLSRIGPSARREKQAGMAAFKNARADWEDTTRWMASEHAAAVKKHRAAFADWQARQSAFHAGQAKANARLDTLRRDYEAKKPDAVAACCDLILLSAARPDGFPKFWWAEYSAKTGVATIDYELPSLDQLPNVKAVKYAAARDTFEAVPMAEREREQLYAEALYQTCLAVLHLLFAADAADAIKAIAFNGWVNFIDKSTGRPGRACILSLQTTKRFFREIDLFAADPQACFKSLNGVVSPKLAAMTATRGN